MVESAFAASAYERMSVLIALAINPSFPKAAGANMEETEKILETTETTVAETIQP